MVLNMNNIFFLYGIPASSKSTWSKEQVRQSNGSMVRVNKDDLRSMIGINNKWSIDSEKLILSIRDEIIMKSLRRERDVIVDDTNFPFGGKHYLRICEIAKLVGDVQVIEKYFDISLEEALLRNNNPDRKPVPSEIIENMYRKYIKPYDCKVVYFPKLEPMIQDEKLQHCIIVDIDGTLALNNSGRSPYDWKQVGRDNINKNIYTLLSYIKTSSSNHNNVSIIIFSGRDSSCELETRRWLDNNKIYYDFLYMRNQDDTRRDSVIKRELFEKYIKDKYYVDFILDDRNQVVELWRSMGLTCLQVNYGDF